MPFSPGATKPDRLDRCARKNSRPPMRPANSHRKPVNQKRAPGRQRSAALGHANQPQNQPDPHLTPHRRHQHPGIRRVRVVRCARQRHRIQQYPRTEFALPRRIQRRDFWRPLRVTASACWRRRSRRSDQAGRNGGDRHPVRFGGSDIARDANRSLMAPLCAAQCQSQSVRQHRPISRTSRGESDPCGYPGDHPCPDYPAVAVSVSASTESSNIRTGARKITSSAVPRWR